MTEQPQHVAQEDAAEELPVTRQVMSMDQWWL